MKKLLSAVLAVSLISTVSSAAFIDGKVVKIAQYEWGLYVNIIRNSDSIEMGKTLDPASTNLKEMLAIALTAKSTGDPVTMHYTDGVWKGISLNKAP